MAQVWFSFGDIKSFRWIVWGVFCSVLFFWSSFVASSDTVPLPEKAGYFTFRETHVKLPHRQLTWATWSLPVERAKLTCFYAASTSRRKHAIACNKACKSRVTSPPGCLQSEGEFTCGVIADDLQLWVFLTETAGIFECNSGYFACVCGYFYLRLLMSLPANCMYFCLQKQTNLHVSPGIILLVKLPVKYPL